MHTALGAEMNENAAIYLRLSRDDRNMNSESESITNQRLLLRQYAEKHGIAIKFEFTDDGISGTKWNRDAFQRLLEMSAAGKIDTVLVKDLSRLSRDYLRTGDLLENWFPEHGIRLISVDDGIDTQQQTAGSDFYPFRAVMDDWYARDISRKVRAAIYAKQRAGYCTAAALPYGYRRENGNIVIVPVQAVLVKQIFALCIQGESCCKIASIINQIPQSDRKWSDTSIRHVLRNTAYFGILQQHKTKKINYKSEYRIRLPQEEAVCYPIPPIIPKEMYDIAQEILKKHAHMRNPRHWLSGKVRCGSCGSVMHITGSGAACRLICGGRKRGSTCKNPSMLMRDLLIMLRNGLPELPEDETVWQRAVDEAVIAPENVTFKVKYRK